MAVYRKKDSLLLPGAMLEAKPKKNFLQENIRRLKEMQKLIQDSAKNGRSISVPNTLHGKHVKHLHPNNRMSNQLPKKKCLRASVYQKKRKSVDGINSSICSHLSTPITAVASLKPMKSQGNQCNLSACKSMGDLTIVDDNKIHSTVSPDNRISSHHTSNTSRVQAHAHHHQNHFKYEKKKEKVIEPKKVTERKTQSNPQPIHEPPKEIIKEIPIQILTKMQPERSDSYIELKGEEEAKMTKLATIISNNQRDFVKKNTRAVYYEKVRPPKPDPTKAPPNYRKGVIPKYLREAKKESEKADALSASTEKDPLCPPGHVRLSDDERKEHLSKIKQTYSDLVMQLNMLPMRSDSLRIKQKKIEMEKELDKLEAGIKIFSKDKLYVKLAS